MIFRQRPSADQLNQMMKGTLMETLGICYLEPEDGILRATMPVDHRTKQPAGLLHGGASAALAESLGSTASYLVIDERHHCVGIEINANHLRAVSSGIVTGICTGLHLGRSMHVWDIRIEDERGRLVCCSRLTVSVRLKAQG